MLKPRNVVLPAAIGFTVSFLICIIATHHFLVSLLRGAIFAVVFAAIAAGIVILYERFLAVDTDSGMPSSGADKKGDKTGTTVDLTIGDANLADDGQGPQFFVANNKLPLNTEDTIKSGSQMKKSDSEIQDAGDDMQNIPMSGSGTSSARMAEENKTAAAPKEGEFKAVDLGTPFTAADAVNPEKSKADGEYRPFADDTLDELPDIGDIKSSSPQKENADSEIIKDSDFATAGQSRTDSITKSPNGSKAANHDAETMAKAIRTLLKKDE